MGFWAIVWIVCWIATIVVASKKGEGGLAVITGLLFGPIALIFALAGSGNKAKCPMCKELINKKAIICPHCRTEISHNTMPGYDEINKKYKESKNN